MKKLVILFLGFTAVAVPMAAQDVITVVGDKVGVLTNTPAAEFHVVDPSPGGNVAIIEGGALQVSRSGSNANIRFTADAHTFLFTANPTLGSFAIRDQNPGSVPFFIDNDQATNTFYMTNNRVGIGTNSPNGKLDVNGAIFQRGSQLHADYVFNESYQLPTIGEHAAKMWAQGHLPAVPARQVDESGQEILEIGAHRRGILEELEVAHIYIEQLHRASSDQQMIIDELRSEVDQLREEMHAVTTPTDR